MVQLLEARRVVEAGNVRLAAARATGSEVVALQELVARRRDYPVHRQVRHHRTGAPNRGPHDQVLAEVVDLGHDVARPLRLYPLQMLVPLHLNSAGLMSQVDGQGELGSKGR